MADYPDGAQLVQVAVTVNNVPVAPTVSTESPAGDVGRYSGSELTYHVVASWAVSAGKTGRLVEVSMMTDNYAKTNFKLQLGSAVFFTDISIGGALTLPFDNLQILAGDSVILSAKSSDGTAIVVDGSITAKEIG